MQLTFTVHGLFVTYGSVWNIRISYDIKSVQYSVVAVKAFVTQTVL